MKAARGFTLAEVIISMAIVALVLGGTIGGYLTATKRAEWSAYSLAAQSLAVQKLEQVRSCKWDVEANPDVDEVVTNNFPAEVNILDIPVTGTNRAYATNFTTIISVSTAPPLKLIRVDCVWWFSVSRRLFTNSIFTFRAPDS